MAQIEIPVTEDIMLDAGFVQETDTFTLVQPPAEPMIDQLIKQLDALPEQHGDFQVQHLSVAVSALCVRWGTYLTTLMDERTELHPSIPGFGHAQPEDMRLTADTEMKRLNIEVSYNLHRLVQVFREREKQGLYDLLWKARAFLPMPHKRSQRSRLMAQTLFVALGLGSEKLARENRQQSLGVTSPGGNGHQASTGEEIPRQDADRYIANFLTYHCWRNTIIEDIHAGFEPDPPLQPHQQRFTRRGQLALLREVTSNLGAAYTMFDILFDVYYRFRDFPSWPETATALSRSEDGSAAANWSLTDSSAPVTLPK